MSILLVEDDAELAAGLTEALLKEGFDTNHVNNGTDALRVISAEEPDIVILDLGLPDLDGIEVLKLLRARAPDLPVLLLTARDSIADKVTGFDSGADDYLAKPFAMPELLARLRALGRRIRTTASPVISIGSVTLDTVRHQVCVDSKPIDLPRREYMLLLTLMENAPQVQTRDQLEHALYSLDEELSSNALEVHVHQLRKKLGANFIRTIRGVGYSVNDA